MAKGPKTDIWLPLYIGDYLADTAHLSTEQHGAYLLLLMHYWRKGPLPTDLWQVILITKLHSTKARGIVQALLEEFFTIGEDGLWHQKRLDAEKSRWNAKSEKSREHAKRAAVARWSKTDAQSTAAASLEQCALPLPSPRSEAEETNIAAKRSFAAPKVASRFSAFRADYEEAFIRSNSVQAPWDAKEATNLSRWMKANSTISRDQWQNILRNRARSPVNQAAPLSRWISNALSWLNGTADDWGKPTKERSFNAGQWRQNSDGKARATIEALRESLGGDQESSG